MWEATGALANEAQTLAELFQFSPGFLLPGLTRFAGQTGRQPSEELGETELLLLKTGVHEGGDHDEPVTLPLGGLPKLQVERLPTRGTRPAALRDHARGDTHRDHRSGFRRGPERRTRRGTGG